MDIKEWTAENEAFLIKVGQVAEKSTKTAKKEEE